MVFNQNNDIENRIITEFVTSGEDKTQQAIDRLNAKTGEVRQRALQANDAFALWEKQGRKLERSVNLKSISDDLVKAARSGKDLEGALAKANAELIRLRANTSETQATIGDAFSRASSSSQSRLVAIGREARLQAPAIPIGPVSSEQIARLVEGFGRVQTAAANAGVSAAAFGVSLGAAGVALAGIALAVSLWTESLEDARQATELLIEARQRETDRAIANREVLESGRTPEENRDIATDQSFELDQLGREAEQFANQRNEAVERQRAALETILGGLLTAPQGGLATAVEGVDQLKRATDEFGQFSAAAEESQKEFIVLSEEFQNTVQVLGPAIDAQAEENKLIEEQTEAMRRTIEESKGRIALETRLAALSKQSSDQLTALLKTNTQRRDALQAEVDALKNVEDETGQLLPQLVEWQTEINSLNGEINTLTNTLIPAAEAAEAAAEAEKEAERQRQKTIDLTQKFQEAIGKLEEDTANARLDIEQDYADKIVDLTRKYTSDIEKATVDLQRKQADIATDLGRDIAQADREARFDRLQEQIEFNQQTAKQSRELERELSRIRDDAANDELDLIRNRDFAGLERLGRDRDRALDQAVDNFNVEQREREIAFRQQQELTNQQLEFEAETRRIRFEQEIDDARLAYNRRRDDLLKARREQERVLAESHQRELIMLGQARNARLKALADGYAEELRLNTLTTQQRIANEAAILAYARQFQLAQASGGITNSTSFNSTLNVQSGASAQQIQQLIPVFRNVAFGLIQEFFN